MVFKIQHHWGQIFWEVFPRGQYREAVFQRWPKCTALWQLNLVCVRVTRVTLALKAWRGHEEQLMLGTGLAGLESLKRGYCWTYNPVAAETPAFQRCRYCGLIIKNRSSSSEVKPAQAWKKSCVWYKGQSQKCDPSLWRIPEDHGWITNIVHWVNYILLDFDFASIWLWVSSGRMYFLLKKVYNLWFYFTRAHSWET